MSAGWVVDDAPGERRAVRLDEHGRACELALFRDSWRGTRALLGDVHGARVIRVDRARRGVFLDIGLGDETGFLPLRRELPRLTEGARIAVKITREAVQGKGATVKFVSADAQGALGVVNAAEHAGLETPSSDEARATCDEAFDAALAPIAPIPGGGVLTIEPTAALVAIDVDAADRAGASDGERFARDLNVAAVKEAVRQLALRRLGGIAAIDCVSVKAAAAGREVADAARAAAKRYGLGDPRFAPLSRFGVLEMSSRQGAAPLHALCVRGAGLGTPETLALEALRRLESEGRANRAARLSLSVGAELAGWLKTTDFDWRAALTGRLGPRFDVETCLELDRNSYEVKAL